METQDKEKEYERNVRELYHKELATANPEKQTQLNKRMLRWQELRDNGLTAVQAYMKAMQEESDNRVVQQPSGKYPAIPSRSWMSKAPLILLSLALVASIIYGFNVTADRNTLNAKLQTVQRDLSSSQAQLNSTKGALSSAQTKLDSAQTKLDSAQNDVLATKTKMDAIEAKLKLYEDTMGIKIYSDIQPACIFQSKSATLPEQIGHPCRAG